METGQSPSTIETAALDAPGCAVNFWKIWSANSFSNLGDGIYQVALPLLAVQLTSSPSLVAGVSVMLSLPWLIFALQAGSIVDRFDRRRVMLWVTGGRIVVLLGLTLLVLTRSLSIGFLYAAALLLGVGETLVDTALTAIVPAVVPTERLNWANARITASQTVTNTFVGPPLAGYLAGVGFALATGFSTVMYLLTALFLSVTRTAVSDATASGAVAQTDRRLWPHLTEGLRFLWKHHLLRSLTLFTASMNFFWAAWGALLVLYAVRPGPMGLGEFEYGLLLTAMAAGGLAGSALCERIQLAIGTRNALVLDFLGTAALMGVPALTTNAIAVGVSAFVAGFGASVWVILVSSIRQRVVPHDLLGRVYSGSRFISWGIGPLGALLSGLAAQLWSVRAVFATGGVVGVLLLVFFILKVRPEMLEGHEG